MSGARVRVLPVRRIAVLPDGDEVECDRDRDGWPRGVCIGATMNGSWPAIVLGRYRRAFYTTNTGREVVVKAEYA